MKRVRAPAFRGGDTGGMPRIPADALYGLGAALTGLLALWWPVPALMAFGLGWVGAVHLLRLRRDKSAHAVRTARRPLVEALWGYSRSPHDAQSLANGIGDLLAKEGVGRTIIFTEFDPDLGRIRGYRTDASGTSGFEADAEHLDGLAGRALRTGRPQSAARGAGLVESLLAPEGDAEGEGWVVLPLLDPAPLAACVDGGQLHGTACPWRDAPETPETDGWRGSCAGCTHDPVRGILAVQLADGVEREGLADFLEGVARTLGTILSLRRLGYRLEMVEAGREQLLDAMLNGLLSTDAEGRIHYMNRRARELFGNLDPAGRRIDEFVTLPAGSTALTRALIEGRATLRAEGLLARESETGESESLPVRVNLTPLRLPEGTIRGAVCVLEDRSDVQALESEVRHLDTLAALGRFASGLAHEVRNPLGGIQAGVEFLEQTGEFTGDAREHLRVIQGEVRRVDSILMDLLQVARPREVVAGPVDPVGLARSVFAGFGSLAETVGVRLEIDAVDNGEEIYVDEQMIRQVLVNLVKNAIEASPTGGVVELRVVPPDPRDASRARAGFIVKDRGAGFSQEDRKRAFEPFFTRKSHGTGLGLYVSHGFVERHGGRLRIEERPGGGTSFCVDLPRVTALVGG